MEGGAQGSNVFDYPNQDTERAKCQSFLQDFSLGGRRLYMDALQRIANRELNVLEIQVDDILAHNNDEEFASNVCTNALRYMKLFEEVADELMPPPTRTDIEPDVFDVLESQRMMQQLANQGENGQPTQQPQAVIAPKALTRRYEVVLLPPSSATKAARLRDIKSAEIGHLVQITGMVTRVSEVKPIVSVVTYTCEACGFEIYQEVFSRAFNPVATCPSQPCRDNHTGGRLHMQTRGSRFVKYQEIRVQELPDQVPQGHIPRSMTVQCRGEQTRQCGPGDLVTISGVFLTVRYTGFRALKAGLIADTYLQACHIRRHKTGYDECEMTREVERQIQELTQDADVYGRLASSIAPEIFGHDDVKKALLLQLVGGVTRTLGDGMKIRGDINICLMGDPGVAKSQLLKYIANVSPRGVYTTGKGSSGVGLTAAVVRDNVTGDMALEGGALVLADKGICCIDEFDKMEDADRTAIHEVMESQTISIAKAGIVTTLNARAAVLAAANPLYGRYNRKKSISENVALPNSLLSRFDLLFLMLDKADMEVDLALSRHVVQVHRMGSSPVEQTHAVSPTLLKHYIAHARRYEPHVPPELTSYIVEAYVSLRMQDASTTGNRRSKANADQAVMTPRQLLSILRLSQALARLRFSDVVAQEDVDEAIRLTHASKASLLDDEPVTSAEDVISSIFSIIRDFAARQKRSVLDYAQVEAMVLRKGFTSAQLNNCLDEYELIGVLTLGDDRTEIRLDT